MNTNNRTFSNLVKQTQQWIVAAGQRTADWFSGGQYRPGAWFEPVPVRRVRRNRYRP